MLRMMKRLLVNGLSQRGGDWCAHYQPGRLECIGHSALCIEQAGMTRRRAPPAMAPDKQRGSPISEPLRSLLSGRRPRSFVLYALCPMPYALCPMHSPHAYGAFVWSTHVL